MNTSQLECFVRVAETFSFQQAADDLHISQPAVSKQIIALETEIGAPLFIRTTRTVALTTVGEKFLADAKRMLQMTYHARQLSAGAQRKEGQMLRIGYTDSGELYFMTRAFQKLKEKYPDFLPLLVYNKWDINTLEVEHGRLDVCFSFKRNGHNSHLVFQQISDNKMVCLMPLSHPLAGNDFIRFEQIKDEQQVCVVPLPHRNSFYNTDRNETFPHSSRDKKIILCDTIAEGYTLVLSGFGWCLLPGYLAYPHPSLRVIPCDYRFNKTHGVYYHEDNNSALLKAFLQAIHDPEQAG